MMAAIIVPGVETHLLAGKSTTPLDPRWITVHTMAGYIGGTEAYFTPAGRPYSHFGAGGNGRIRQWQDLRFRAASDKDGNPFSISIECEDHGPGFPAWSGSDVPRFTAAQADSLVVLLSWLCHRFGLPKRAIGSSCPHERGIGWHRLGIDPWRRPECLSWSSSRGKACPGDRRIAQLRAEIIPRVSSPPEVDDVTPQDHAQIKAAVDAAVDRAAKQTAAFLQGRTSTVFDPAKSGNEWMRTAVSLPRILDAAGADVDELALATAVLAVLTPQAIAAAIPPELGRDVVEALTAELSD